MDMWDFIEQLPFYGVDALMRTSAWKFAFNEAARMCVTRRTHEQCWTWNQRIPFHHHRVEEWA